MLVKSPSGKIESFIRLVVCAIVICLVFALLASGPMPKKAIADNQDDTPQVIHTVFSNPAAIACVDRASNNAGTNPGLPPLYPSTINVSGLGTITKVTVTFAITTTFPDDLDVLLVGPTGARSLVMSDAGGSGDHTNVSFTWDQTAATLMPDGPTTPIPSGTFRPSNYVGFVTPEPGGVDNFPAPGPGLLNYTADFNVFNGLSANGTWSLYVVDDQVIDLNSLPGGWSLDITSIATSNAKTVDFDGDGKTDPAVLRNTGGGPNGQVTWFIQNSSGVPVSTQRDWGMVGDFFVPEDYDGDGKTDIAVWRPGPPFNAYFYILQSSTVTLRFDQFGQVGDDPTVVGDYDGDGKADPAVYRSGPSAGDHSFWYYRGSTGPNSGLIIGTEWGQNGDFPAPGDYDGDGKNDFGVQRNFGGGQAIFFMKQTTAGNANFVFGTPGDFIVPGDYDGDGKTDIATVRGVSGQIHWFIRRSSDGVSTATVFGASASDYPTQGDWDGDGKTDLATWRPDVDPTLNFFRWRRSSDSTDTSVEWGQNADYPVANFNVH